jgi:hypothetical protein
MEMFEREAKQATARIREVGVAIWREWSWLVYGGLSVVFFFLERQLLSLLLSFFFRCASSQHKQMQLGSISKILRK